MAYYAQKICILITFTTHIFNNDLYMKSYEIKNSSRGLLLQILDKMGKRRQKLSNIPTSIQDNSTKVCSIQQCSWDSCEWTQCNLDLETCIARMCVLQTGNDLPAQWEARYMMLLNTTSCQTRSSTRNQTRHHTMPSPHSFVGTIRLNTLRISL